jgi:uncharacterized protein (DUF362 family)
VAPFDPSEDYPELRGIAPRRCASNAIYVGVRETFRLLGLDAARYGTPDWSPLSGIVRPGDEVVIKPNMVRHFHGDGGGLDALVTHGSVVRPLLDYVLLALQGRGTVTIGDAPLQYADFHATAEATGVAAVVDDARGRTRIPVALMDFRKERSEKRGGIIATRVPNDGDPAGYQEVDLGPSSRFAAVNGGRARRFRVTQYDPRVMARAHTGARHAYLFPRTILNSDVLINVPKLKTHRKAGVTGAMKNLVGINGSKDWLPHHTAGPRDGGGDEYRERSARKAMVSAIRDALEGRRSGWGRRLLYLSQRAIVATGKVVSFPDPFWEGSWHGNDTVWRMVHDLHRVLLHADASGALHERPVRRYFALVDAVVAGEGEGPMRPAPRATGLLLAGENPAAIDATACRLMGFDPLRIPLLRHAIGDGFALPIPALEAIQVVTNRPEWERPFALPRARSLHFVPPAGWAGTIEIDP